ncbi:MAG: DUF4390 domain-containing protein [Deferribacteres bacterium]|nr:DUF4390 domain-containing protein [candidate division KSB1 bacterium]MCB9502203.1 DUF4390 domain-containing protein [Deferribacteres bacterium]
MSCFIYLLLGFASSTLVAQDNRIIIAEAVPFVKEEFVGVRFVLAPFFTQKVSGTIQSGLPSVLEIELTIRDEQNNRVAEFVVLRRISYNIWDEKYRLDSADTTLYFKSFTDLQKACLLLKSAPFVKLATFAIGENYKLHVRAGLKLISSLQTRKLAGWLDKSYQETETISSDESSSGFRLSLGALVSMFMGDSAEKTAKAGWQVFPFSLTGLQK